MSVFDRQGAPLPGSVDNSDDQRQKPGSTDSGGSGSSGEFELMGDVDGPQAAAFSATADLDPHKDARKLVRLVQCQQCSLPLRQPLTLACGNSICKRCLPETHRREGITYPMNVGRDEGFQCPFEDCRLEHSVADCSQDVTLAKVLDRVSIEVARTRPLTSNTPTLLDERPRWRNIVDFSTSSPPTHSRILSGGRLVATYTLAELGELAYDSDLSYQPQPPNYDSYQHLDLAMLQHLRESTRTELDCNLCYALMLDPITTACGHTWCRKCFARVLDHGNLCPECRRPLHTPPAALPSLPSNKRLSKLLLALCAEHVAARAAASAEEEQSLAAPTYGLDPAVAPTDQLPWVPLFVCTLAYPSIPTFLHIFEPRYRLMIRRAMEHDRQFGMLAYNQRGEPQGALGRTQFMKYGTLLEVVNLQLLPDGRSLIETRGVSRFCVEDHGMRDGYVVGRVRRVDDVGVAEEEDMERREVLGAQAGQPNGDAQSTRSSHSGESGQTTNSGNNNTAPPQASQAQQRPISSLPTSELLHISVSFIERMHAASAPWLSHSSIAAYGSMPSDPAIFPYWFASVLPIDDGEKYRLLAERSVRGRLKITVEWVRRVEGMRWFSGGSCIVL